jgi:hypothetical protein
MGGALAHPYPIGAYNFDTHINTGVTRIKSNIAMAVQTIASFVWLGLLYLVKGSLLLLEWAFSLDLLSDALRDVRRALLRLHRDVLGETWFIAALSVAGLWGIWRGFIQRRAIETISGLAATIALMVVGLVLITNPTETVGKATALTNEASLAMLSGASSGSFGNGEAAFGDSIARVFDGVALEPWCSLEFGDVDFCLAKPPKDVPSELSGTARSARSVADLWLRFPAGGSEREALYEHWKQDGKRTQPKVRMQKEGSTATRVAMLALIAIGVLGAVALLAWFGFKLIFYAILALVLLLLAPAMLLAPAFGDSGRRTFVGWTKRLLAAIVAKAIFALLLALVLVAAGVLARLDSIGWFATWLLQTVFWWGLFLKRGEFIGWLTVAGSPHRGGSSLSALRLYQGARAAEWGIGAIRRRVGGTVAAPVGAVGRANVARRDVRGAATRVAAREELGEHADRALRIGLSEQRGRLERNEELERELRDTRRGLTKYDTLIQAHKEWGKLEAEPSDKEAALLRRRQVLEDSRESPEAIRQAHSIVGRADRNLALQGREFTEADHKAIIDQRRRDIAGDLPLDHERNLRFAGIEPREFERAAPEERARMEEQVGRSIERDRGLLGALPPDERTVRQRDLRMARLQLPPSKVRERIREEHRQRRSERRRHSVRQRLYRPR